jgi:hypothetical protein
VRLHEGPVEIPETLSISDLCPGRDLNPGRNEYGDVIPLLERDVLFNKVRTDDEAMSPISSPFFKDRSYVKN